MSSRSPDLPPDFLRLPLAHRGLHDRGRGMIENSRAAIRAAMDGGYGIEMDIQGAADGEPMVFHDYSLDRLTDRTGRVAEHEAACLGAMELRGGGETIPTLGEILALVGGRAPLLIEIKDPGGGTLGETDGVVEAWIGTLLAPYHGPAALMSFNPSTVAALAETAPDRPRGLTSCGFPASDWPLPRGRREALAALKEFDRTGASFISHDHKNLGNPAVARLKSRGVPVLCWTIRSAAVEHTARLVADNITFEGYKPATPG